MKILLINNYQQGNETATFEALVSSLAEHEVKIQRYQPGINFDDHNHELVILSGGGGEGSEINDQYSTQKLWYQDQINYVLSSSKPILGICMGFEVIARAYGSRVIDMKDYVTGFKRLTATKTGSEMFNKKSLIQHQNHRFFVKNVSLEHFDVLAESETGIEIIKHKSRPILATQFHPEKGGSLQLNHLLSYI